jgi:hypothetical protein
MLVAFRLAGLSALGAHYPDDNAQAQSGIDEHRSDAVLDRLRSCELRAASEAKP